MEHPDLARTCRRLSGRPPAVFVSAVVNRRDRWQIDDGELQRAEWMWLHRPDSPLQRLMQHRPFFAFTTYALATLPLVVWVHVLAWAACFALYPLFVYTTSQRIARWERCYRQALRRIVRC